MTRQGSLVGGTLHQNMMGHVFESSGGYGNCPPLQRKESELDLVIWLVNDMELDSYFLLFRKCHELEILSSFY